MLNPKNLRVFLDVADLGSISRAAASSGIAQSAVSRHIAELERELEGRLFHRTGRGVVPTELGQSMLPRTRALLVEMEAFSADARARSGNAAGTVDLGFVPAISGQLTSVLYSRIRERFPEIKLRIFEGYSGQIEDWLASGKIDIALFNSYRPAKGRAYERLLTTEMLLIGAAGSRPVRRGPVAFESLAGLPMVLPSLPNTLRSLLEEHAHKKGFALRIEVEANSSIAIKELVANSALFTTLPYHAVAADLAAKRFHAARIAGPSLKQVIVLATGTQRPLTVATRQVAKVLPALVNEFIPASPSSAKPGA